MRDPKNDEEIYIRQEEVDASYYTKLAYKNVDQPVAAYAIYTNSSVTLQTLAGDTYNVNFGQHFHNDGEFYEPNFDLDFRQLAAQQYPAVFGAGVSDSKVVVGYRRRFCYPYLCCLLGMYEGGCGTAVPCSYNVCHQLMCCDDNTHLCCFPKLATVTKPALLTPWSLVPPTVAPDADTVKWTPDKRAHYGYDVDTGIVNTVREVLQFSVKLDQPWTVVFDHQGGGGGGGGGGSDSDNIPIRDQPRRFLSQSHV